MKQNTYNKLYNLINGIDYLTEEDRYKMKAKVNKITSEEKAQKLLRRWQVAYSE